MSYRTCIGCGRKAQVNFHQYCSACQISESVSKSSDSNNSSGSYNPSDYSSEGTLATIPTLLLGLVCIGIGFSMGWLNAGLIFIVGFLVFRLLNRLADSYPLVKWVMVAINLFIVYMLLDAFGVFG